MILLKITEPGRQPRHVPMAGLGQTVSIGRAPNCVIRLSDGRVSAKHCELRRTRDGYEIADGGSSNGTRVDGARIQRPVPLTAGMAVLVGGTTIEVESAPTKPPAEHQTLEFDLAAISRRIGEFDAVRRDASATTALAPPAPTVMIDNPDLNRQVTRQSGASLHTSSLLRTIGTSGSRTSLIQSLHHTVEHRAEKPVGRAMLEVVSGADDKRSFLLDYGDVLIGRDPRAEIVFDDERVSRKHARISVERAGVFIEDLTNKRRTRVNNRRIRGRHRLDDGDLIRISEVILEFSGGWSDESGELASLVSRYVVGEDVFEQPSLLIGSDRHCDVVLDDDSIEPEHIYIERLASGQFYVTDRSAHGMLLDGKLSAEGQLGDGARVGFGQLGLRVSVSGSTCQIDLVQSSTRSISLERLVGHTGEPTADGRVRPGQPKLWTPPGDVQTNPWDRRLVRLGALVAIIGLLVFLVTRGDGGLLERPVSPVHSGVAFAQASDDAACRGCHTNVGSSVGAAACVRCHADQHPRQAHASRVDPATSRGSLDCLDCHAEHPTAVGGAFPRPTAGCASGGCHTVRHRELADAKTADAKTADAKTADAKTADAKAADAKAADREPGGSSLDAETLARLRQQAPVVLGATAERFLSQRRPEGLADLHAAHSGIERRCIGCHAGDQRKQTLARDRCVSCHDVEEALTSDACGQCHAEHGADPKGLASRGMPEDTPAAGSGLAIGLSMVLFAFILVRRRWNDPGPGPTAPPEPPPKDPKLDIHIFRSLCVGSSACVDACPYRVLELAERTIERDGVILTERFATVANFESCNECNTCQEVCAPQALVRVAPGQPVPGLMRPELDANYMTTVPGMYLIGQASGVSFVRNAINLGFRTVHHIRHAGLDPARGHQRPWQTDIVVVGAGPAGLSTALTAGELGFRAVVLERGPAFATNIRAFHKGKKVQHQPANVRSKGTLWMQECNREELLDAWTRQLEGVDLDLRFGHAVERIEPIGQADSAGSADTGFRVTVRREPGNGTEDATMQITAARVVLALGGGDPRVMEIPGAELTKVATACVDPDVHDGDRICVVGGGNSALEVAIACAEANGGRNEVRLVYRKDKFARASARNQQRVAALVAQERILLHLSSEPVLIDEYSISIEGPDGQQARWPNNFVYTMLGYQRPQKWLEAQGVSFSEQPRDWSPAQSDDVHFMEIGGQR